MNPDLKLPCPNCKGQGDIDKNQCLFCKGTGYTSVEISNFIASSDAIKLIDYNVKKALDEVETLIEHSGLVANANNPSWIELQKQIKRLR